MIFLSGKIGQEPHNLLGDRPEVSTSSFGQTLEPFAYFPLRGNWAREFSSQKSSIPDFCIALLGIAPRFSRDVPLSNYNKAMSHERQNHTTWVSTSSFGGDFGHPCPIFLSGKLGKGIKIPLYPDFCIALLGIAPRFSRDVPLVTTTRLCLMKEAEPHNMGFYLFIQGTLDTLALFSLRKIGQR